jgi:hypothetical protein
VRRKIGSCVEPSNEILSEVAGDPTVLENLPAQPFPTAFVNETLSTPMSSVEEDEDMPMESSFLNPR